MRFTLVTEYCLGQPRVTPLPGRGVGVGLGVDVESRHQAHLRIVPAVVVTADTLTDERPANS